MSLRPRLLDTAASNLGRTMPPRLSIDSNRFTLIDSTGNERPINSLTLDVVFIDLNPKTSKLYFGKEYNPNDTTDIPKCWSDNGIAPSSQADQPQSPQCMTCPNNVIGSSISKFSGAKIKACVDMKKLAFVVPGDPSKLIYLYTLKPGSFKNWTSTINWLKAQKMGDQTPDLPDVIMQLSFESQGVLAFKPSALANDPALLAQIEEAYARNVTDDIVGKNDQPWTGQAQVAAQQPSQQLPPPPTGFGATSPPPPQVQPQTIPTQTLPVGQPAAPFQMLQQPAPPAEPPKKRRGRAAGATAATGFQAPGQPALGPLPPAAQPFPTYTPPQPAPLPAAPPPVTPPVGQAAGTEPLDIPPFLRRDVAPAPSVAAPQLVGVGGFGLTQPQAPDAGMQAAIDAAFKLPT